MPTWESEEIDLTDEPFGISILTATSFDIAKKISDKLYAKHSKRLAL